MVASMVVLKVLTKEKSRVVEKESTRVEKMVDVLEL